MKYFTYIYTVNGNNAKVVIPATDSDAADALFEAEVEMHSIYLIAEFETAEEPKFNFFD